MLAAGNTTETTAERFAATRLDGDSMAEIITCEDVTDEVVAAYANQGYALTFAEDVMRYDLSDQSRPLAHVELPFAVTYLEWTPERAHDFFTVYYASFRERPGFPGWSEAEWVQWTAGDPTFRTDLSKLAVIPGHAVGFVTSADYEEEQAQYGFVIQVGVHPGWRGQKLGTALISHTLQAWQCVGKEAVILDVNLNNPGAIRLYLQLGFVVVRRRGKFSRSSA
jgi:ribosomal protein S18 acetylase RimI-like enzyme